MKNSFQKVYNSRMTSHTDSIHILMSEGYCCTICINRGGGTGPADPAAAGPIIYSDITTENKELSQEYFSIECS